MTWVFLLPPLEPAGLPWRPQAPAGLLCCLVIETHDGVERTDAPPLPRSPRCRMQDHHPLDAISLVAIKGSRQTVDSYIPHFEKVDGDGRPVAFCLSKIYGAPLSFLDAQLESVKMQGTFFAKFGGCAAF